MFEMALKIANYLCTKLKQLVEIVAEEVFENDIIIHGLPTQNINITLYYLMLPSNIGWKSQKDASGPLMDVEVCTTGAIKVKEIFFTFSWISSPSEGSDTFPRDF